MYLTPKRIETQLRKADKLSRILWRLYSPYKTHRKLIVKASYKIIEVVEILEELLKEVKKDFQKEMEQKDKKGLNVPPGYYDKKE